MYESITISSQLLALADRLGFEKSACRKMPTKATETLLPGHSSTQ